MRHPHFCPYGPFPAGDGRLFGFAVLSDDHWRSFTREVLGRPDLHDDLRFASNELRVAHRGELEPELVGAFVAAGADEWLDRLQAAGIPSGAVNGIPEVMNHPQLAHNRLITEVGSPAGGLPTVGNPFLVGGERPGLGAVPGLGEHTGEVLAELGLEPR